ncbi:MAG: ATP synthase epsilon chain [Phycisphaerae bacterium]|nr:MAG: ATP synthase epsilon chain [Phycisphaerae bacterium]
MCGFESRLAQSSFPALALTARIVSSINSDMAKAPLHCNVITPERQVLETDAVSVVLPAHDGLVGVLDQRAPLLCELGTGILRVETDAGKSQQVFVDGGFAQVLKNEVTILTERAALAENITADQARKALEEAQAMPAKDESTAAAKQRAIARAKAQLTIAGK